MRPGNGQVLRRPVEASVPKQKSVLKKAIALWLAIMVVVFGSIWLFVGFH